jgi:glycine/D-amino acid oxidase-like deaminating enzyme
MPQESADVVICGAGIAGVALAHQLAVRQGAGSVLLVDERPPLTLTSDKSTEAYRNWWAGPDGAMVALMNRSIDLLEELAGESGNAFHLNRRGYLYGTADPAHVAAMRATGARAEAQGAGPLRVHEAGSSGAPYRPASFADYRDQPDGADLILDPALIRRHFPYLAEHTAALLHARRCGWFSGQQLGMLLLERARARGMVPRRARLTGVGLDKGRVASVRLSAGGGKGAQQEVATGALVLASGPLLRETAALLGVELPVYTELHLKIALKDVRGAIPREAPFLIWEDPQRLRWDRGTAAGLAADPATRGLLEPLPPGVHARPEGGANSRTVLMLWSYDARPVPVVFPHPVPPHYPELVLRGMAAMVPGLDAYLARLPAVSVDGGYYTRTRENRPLCGPLPVPGAWVLGALGGFGMMASQAAAELVGAHLAGRPLPAYAPAFSLERYAHPSYLQRMEAGGGDGQI